MIHRRSFLRRGAAAAAAPIVIGAAPNTATLIIDRADPIATAVPVQRAVDKLERALKEKGFKVLLRTSFQKGGNGLSILIGRSASAVVEQLNIAVSLPKNPEGLTVASLEGLTLVCGTDVRGLMYGVLEAADRVRFGVKEQTLPGVEQHPANPVRSVMRQFVSELYDKPWYYDRAMWPKYLSMLAANRFNRFQLAFGLGYDMLKKVDDPYFVFTYPFLTAVPGHDVRVTNLSDAERARNLDTLRFISEQTVAHGLDFELGLWMHGYEWKDTPDAKYVVTGLTPETQAAYCRDAMTALLKALPAVSSVGLRIHGESGVAEGSYDFWKTIFDGVARCGRKVEIDLHAKGIDDKMIETALATGMPVNIAPKFSAEHLGLPYHQADIRPSEIPAAGVAGKGLMAISEGRRSFTRYGYADLMRDDRKYTVRIRVFAGTQRILASGNAEAAAAYGRAFQFCGMTGAELMEPLTCRGRRGTAAAGSPRDGYANRKLATKYDWQKYDYWYRTFGRMMFNPDGDPETCRRAFGSHGAALESALASASRILPLVTQAHSESAACDLYWPEVYWNLPMASEAERFYWDTPSPKNFQNVIALDPQLFSSCREFAGELLGERSGKYSPFEVAMWLDKFAADSETALAAGKLRSVDAMRLSIDVEVQALLGRFFAAKLRSGVFVAIHERSDSRAALAAGLLAYKKARGQWAKIVERTKGVYAADLSVSDRFTERGQWGDRLKDIDTDIAALEARLEEMPAGAALGADSDMLKAVLQVLAVRELLPSVHTGPSAFTPAQTVDLVIAVRRGITSARLWYRHVNQAERWSSVEMTSAYEGWRASIPAAYTDSPFPLQYYFEFRDAPDKAWLYPGFNEDLLNQPYFVLRRG
jgi:hypothetical protein